MRLLLESAGTDSPWEGHTAHRGFAMRMEPGFVMIKTDFEDDRFMRFYCCYYARRLTRLEFKVECARRVLG